jgi:hypothetical protein
VEQRTDCARFKRPSGDASVHSTMLRSRSPLGSLSFSDNLTTKRQVPKGRPETTPGLDNVLTEGRMNYAGLRKEASETGYLWAAAGVSIAVIFALVAL